MRPIGFHPAFNPAIPEKHFKMTRYYDHNHKRIPLEELYEKAMAQYRCRSSVKCSRGTQTKIYQKSTGRHDS